MDPPFTRIFVRKINYNINISELHYNKIRTQHTINIFSLLQGFNSTKPNLSRYNNQRLARPGYPEVGLCPTTHSRIHRVRLPNILFHTVPNRIEPVVNMNSTVVHINFTFKCNRSRRTAAF